MAHTDIATFAGAARASSSEASPTRGFVSRLRGRAIWPLLCLALLASLTCAAIVTLLSIQMDKDAALERQQMVRGAYVHEVASLAPMARDYTHWDDAVTHLYGSIDRHWAATNIGGTYTNFVLGHDGHTLYGADPTGSSLTMETVAEGVRRQLYARLPKRREQALHAEIVSVVGLFRGKPAVFAAGPIVPGTSGQALPSDIRYSVTVKPLNDAVLRGWANAFGLSGIRRTTTANRSTTGIEIRDADGRFLSAVEWDAVHPSRRAIVALFPVLTVSALLLIALLLILSRVIIRAERALIEQTAAAETAALEEARARAEAIGAQHAAEQALAQAKSAKDRAEQLGERQRREEDRHREQMRASAIDVATRLEATIGHLTARLLDKADQLEKSANSTLASVRAQESDAAAAQNTSKMAMDAMAEIEGRVSEMLQTSSHISDAAFATRCEMVRIDGRASSVADAAALVQKHVNTIEAASELIGGIATRTNLLALNASIEAARAGENGKGFVIVANEVKTLAGEAKRRAADISRKIAQVEQASASSATMVATLHGHLKDASGSAEATASAAEQQKQAASAILLTSHAVGSEAQSAFDAVNAIVEGLGIVSASATDTRAIGLDLRDEMQRLEDELHKLIEDLRNV